MVLNGCDTKPKCISDKLNSIFEGKAQCEKYYSLFTSKRIICTKVWRTFSMCERKQVIASHDIRDVLKAHS